MINYAGMKAEESKGDSFGQLPVGPYVAVVLGVRITGAIPDQSLEIQLDVSEGEYAGFFMKKYKAMKDSSKYEVKYKGIYRLRIPNPDNKNAMYPESDLRRFNDLIYRFEKSNDGFHWDGNEGRLKGLTVGINMQEDSYNGNQFTRIGRLETADDVRKGLVKAMAPRKRQGNALDPTTIPNPVDSIPTDSQSGMQVIATEELPW